jgi:hypothetical protein
MLLKCLAWLIKWLHADGFLRLSKSCGFTSWVSTVRPSGDGFNPSILLYQTRPVISWKAIRADADFEQPLEHSTAMSDTDRFDALLMNMAQTQRGIEPLLETVFSFLRRKTDFFSGATPAVVEETVLNAVRKQAALAEKDQYAKKQEEEAKRKQREQKKRAEEEAKLQEKKLAEAAAKPKATEPEPTPRFEEVTDEQAETITKAATAPPAKDGEEEEKEDDTPRMYPCCVVCFYLVMY